MADVTGDAQGGAAVAFAQRYATACLSLVAATNACLEVTNDAIGARDMAAKRPQHEVSIKQFTQMAEQKEQEFVPLYRAFTEACSAARDAAASFLSVQAGRDPELVFLSVASDEAYREAQVARHILLADYGPTPDRFIAGLEETNAGIRADIFNFGEDGFQGRIYAPPPTHGVDERVCPWCAETIKAAAVICRYCGRDVPPALSGQPMA